MEGSRIMDLDCVVEEFSDSLQLCEPLSVSSCRSLVAPDILGTDVLAGAFNSISIIESSGQRDDEGKEKVEFDDASEIQCADTKCLSSPRRSVKVNQKRQTRKAARKCGKIVIKQPLFDSIRLTVARKRRSYLCKPARSSVWGSSGYITQLFVQNTGVDVNQNEITKSRKARGVQGNRKRIKSHSHTSKVEKAAPTGRIRLKITIGKEAGQSCLKNVVSVNNNSTRDNLETSIEVPKLSDCNENKLKEYLPGINGVRCCNPDPAKVVTVSEASQLNMVIAEKYLEIPMTCEKSAGVPVDAHQLGLSQIEIERSGVGGDNSYVDSGTSPDSEVINLIPETQLGGRSQEYFHDGLISSQACVTPGDFGSLNLPPTSSKKGKKKDKLPHVVNFIMEDRLPSPEIINNASELEKRSQGDKGGDGFYSSEASISTAVANASVSTSSCEGFPRGSLSSSRVTDCGLSAEEMKVVGGTEEDLRFGLDVRLESPESHDSKKVLLYSKTKGRKHLKKSKSGGLNNSCLELSDSPRSQRGNACRKKGNSGKSVSRRKVKDESACDGVICKVESFPEKGKHSLDDAGGTKAGDENSFMDIFNLDGKQHVLPRKAWVCCDDCFKWRRIAATLADSIEETNCRWTCKDSLDKEFSDCSIPQEKSNAEINVELQISDVSGEEDAYDTPLNPKRLELKHLTAHEQSSWMLVKSNLFLNRGRKTQTIDEIMVCHCKRHPVGRMGCGDGCLNRMLNIECVEGTCPCGELCSNQQFQKHHYAKLRWFRCGKKGYGLQSVEDISEGQFLIEYVGEVLDMHAYEMRQREYASMGHKHFYFMTLNGSEVIDACAKGNLGRFINHSCDPNCRTEKWMVNGEVCIGLFALRDIKKVTGISFDRSQSVPLDKGEEVTFDYNYVRVFGAAAKKCVCGSSQCRGYLGGDPLNSEVIVQGDSDEEYPEPVMFCEDGDIDDNFKHWISPTSSLDATEIQTADNIFGNKKKRDKSATAVGYSTELKTAESLVKDEHEVDKSATAVQHLEIVSQISLNKSASDAPLRLSLEMTNSDDTLPLTVQRVEPSSQVDDASSKTIFDVEQGSVQRSETFAPFATTSKLLSDTIDDNKYMSNAMEEKRASKSHRRMKTSRSSASVKKEKLKSNTLVVNKPDMSVNKTNVLPYKPRKIMEGSLNGRFEAVEEKLNELLDADGGVSKRKDAPRGYLKLLFVTANGEAIQSNRDLSMILDALLKTKSRTVLVDIISKNGLQMLHNMMKRSRREFNKTPILRKLLKVLEYLAVREILTLEHINAGPPREGVESFRDSILTLTEHDDRQVHQIARNFRDRWIPRPAKKSCSIDRSDGRVEFHRGSNSHRYSAPQNHWQDQGVNTTEVVNCIKEPIVATNSAGAGNLEGCSASGASCCTASGLKTRKRKSRWDQPAEVNTDARSPQHKESKVEPSLLQKSCSDPQTDIGEVPLDHMNGINGGDRHGLVHNVSQQMEASGNDAVQNVDEDFPPGFLPVNPPSVLPNAPPTATDTQQENGIPAKFSCEVVMGHPHERFINRLAVSYGIPLPVVQQFGVPEAETLESWVVAPGVPFRPFPPLPPYPRDKRGAPPCAGYPLIKNEHAGKVEQGSLRYNICQSDQNTPSTSGTSPPDVAIQGANNQHNFQGAGGSNVLGRKYFRQQKWNHSGVGVAPPWNQKRNWHCEGNNFRNRMCNVGVATVANEIKGPNISPGVRTGVENACNTFCQYPQQQNYH